MSPRYGRSFKGYTMISRQPSESLNVVAPTLPDLEAVRAHAVLRFHTLAEDRESRYRELEQARLLVVSARLPQRSDSARYILTQILAEEHCLVCDSDVPDVSRSMESRIQDNECVVCGSKLPGDACQDPD